jgi:hypothetical protein
MSDVGGKKVQLTNNLTFWSATFTLPPWIVQTLRDNGLETVEEVGKLWFNDAKSFDKIFASMELTKEFVDKTVLALNEAENYYKQQKKAKKMADNRNLSDLETEMLMNEENVEYRREKVSLPSSSPSSSPSSPSKKENEVSATAESMSTTRICADQGEKSSVNRMNVEPLRCPASEGKRHGTAAVPMDEEPTALIRSSSGRDDSTRAPTASSSVAASSSSSSAFTSPQVDLQEWISEKQIPSEIAEGLTIFSIFTTGMLAEASDEIINQLGEKVKPIPRKKFLAAMRDLKQKLGVLPSEQPAPVPPSVPAAVAPSIMPPSHTDNHYAVAAGVSANPSPVSAPPHSMEEDIGGEMILISTEIDRSVEDLRTQLEYENNIIETLIQLTVNSREKFSDKALEIMNQSKLDHQDRAKRIKKLILHKRSASPSVAASGGGEEGKPPLTRGRSTDGEVGSVISHCDSTIIPSDPAKSLSFNLYASSHSVIRSADFRRTRDHISLEKLKLNVDSGSSKAVDPNAATVRKSEAGMLFMVFFCLISFILLLFLIFR